jgi:NAD(P)-dependent dehydrogenase (short-subunit alcohol dehydrogenase family)
MDVGMNGRTVIVTGASGGLGRTIARGFADEGADVVLTYHGSRTGAELVAKEIDGRTLLVRFDLADPSSAAELVDATLEWTGRIDVLINNAVYWGGDAPSPDSRFETVPEEHWLTMLRTNLEGTVRLSRAVIPTMRERKWGRLVHVSSSVVTEGMPGGEYYATAKAALHGFSRSAAFGVGRDGDILTNVVMPGLTRTDTNAAITDAEGHFYSAKAPIGRLLDAAEVAGPIVFLGSAANTGITGQVIAVNGGV